MQILSIIIQSIGQKYNILTHETVCERASKYKWEKLGDLITRFLKSRNVRTRAKMESEKKRKRETNHSDFIECHINFLIFIGCDFLFLSLLLRFFSLISNIVAAQLAMITTTGHHFGYHSHVSVDISTYSIRFYYSRLKSCFFNVIITLRCFFRNQQSHSGYQWSGLFHWPFRSSIFLLAHWNCVFYLWDLFQQHLRTLVMTVVLFPLWVLLVHVAYFVFRFSEILHNKNRKSILHCRLCESFE